MTDDLPVHACMSFSDVDTDGMDEADEATVATDADDSSDQSCYRAFAQDIYAFSQVLRGRHKALFGDLERRFDQSEQSGSEVLYDLLDVTLLGHGDADVEDEKRAARKRYAELEESARRTVAAPPDESGIETRPEPNPSNERGIAQRLYHACSAFVSKCGTLCARAARRMARMCRSARWVSAHRKEIATGVLIVVVALIIVASIVTFIIFAWPVISAAITAPVAAGPIIPWVWALL